MEKWENSSTNSYTFEVNCEFYVPLAWQQHSVQRVYVFHVILYNVFTCFM